MSMEMHVLFHGKLPTKAALTRAMKELGFPLSIAPPGGSLEQQKGYMPMRLKREETGVELDVFDGRAVVEEVAGERSGDVDPTFDRSASFRWSGDENEMLCALCGAVALAKLVSGVVFEEQEGKLLRPDEAIGYARQHLEPLLEQQRQGNKEKLPGTRPADIKRYLKPLLELRSDLVLVGRMLVVRPVRHVLRGAFFDRTGDKYQFQLWRYVKPLHDHPDSLGYGGGSYYDVWQPYFQPLLMDVLAGNIFTDVGRITTLAEAAGKLNDGPGTVEITSLLLAGERDRIVEYLRRHDLERSDAQRHRRLWEFVETDINTLCAKCHAREAETAKALKIEHIWEPSPFPVELPAAERARVAEPVFQPVPWIDRPSWLLGEGPEAPGDVRFGKGTIWRDGRVMMMVPLTREEAEQRHCDREDYALAARLPDGHITVIRRSGWDRNDPGRFDVPPGWRPFVDYSVALYASSHSAFARTSSLDLPEGIVAFFSIEVFRRGHRPSIWLGYFDPSEGKRSIYDRRGGEEIYSKTALTPAERDLATFPISAFGEFGDLVDRMFSLLRVAGYGDLT